MTGVLIAVAIITVWAIGFIPTLRWQFGRWRPYTEPLSCRWNYRGHEHDEGCYRREGTLIESAGAALGWAAFTGLIWPAFWATSGARAMLNSLATASIRETPEEIAAKTARLERELGIKP